jgi:LacI family transcriptional regulator
MAEKLGYAPNGLAQALRTNRSHTLALISEEIATVPYAGRLIRGAQEAAFKHGWIMLIMSSGGVKEVEDREIEAVWRHQVDGVIYADTAHRVIGIPEGLEGKPVFLANAEALDGQYWSVFPDEIQGGYIATRELIEAGHTEIGFVSTAMDIPARTGRLRGYRSALDEAGLRFDPSLVIEAASSFAEDGYRGACTLLSRKNRPTALFCFNDRMAMGAYRAAAEWGLIIPEDLSVVGFDNQEIIAEALSPQLTTVALPYYEMGAMAVDAMIAELQDGTTGENRQGAIPNILVRRTSVAVRA